ncbi:FAD:protein FMN transferase [Deinococcus sonorensis]|uniref:FAD:protein FMN transferase n=2 Tax=Deinococcus sonorensis TaxID=309891 RepID=A0AAU7UCY6_9DEIO
MNTRVEAQGPGAEAALQEVARLERMLTRFHDSPLTRLNRDGRLDRPPAELREALGHALSVAHWSGGLITPTVLPALERIGSRPGGVPVTDGPRSVALPAPDWRGIALDEAAIVLPAGVTLDLGGTAKSWIVRQAAGLLDGPDWLLDAGGDLLISSSELCTVQIEHPYGRAAPLLALPPGRHGVATSSVLKRRFVGGHHLIDPRTGESARSPFVQATAVCRDVTWAEVLTKLALLDPSRLPAGGAALVLAYRADGSLHRWTGRAFVPSPQRVIRAA